MIPIAIQLWSLRTQAQADLRGTLQAVADMGYAGVQAGSFHGETAASYRSLVEDLGMRIVPPHNPPTQPDTIEDAIATARVFESDLVYSGFDRAAYADLEAIRRTAGIVNGMCVRLADAGLKLFLHNHSWELTRHDGRWGIDWMAELCPEVLFEVDVFHAAAEGREDPVRVVEHLRGRIPFLHLRDGPLGSETAEANTAVGSGAVDIPACVAACGPETRWLIVEFNKCPEPDIITARKSIDYLLRADLGVGTARAAT